MIQSSTLKTPTGDVPASYPETAPRVSKPAGHLFTGALAVFVVSLFMAFIFNRYLPINEGWFHYYAWLMHKGQMPYRDFWFFGQPVSLFYAWLFAGDHLINLRIFGLVEQILISGMLYFLLSREFSPKACFLATVLAMMVFLSYLTEGFFSYLVDALLLLMIALICVYQAQTRPERYKILLVVAGIFTALSFFAKQSSGVFSAVALAILVAWPAVSLTRLIARLIYFAIGWCIATLPIVGWLMLNGAWHPYVMEVFTGAAAAKGSLTTVLFTSLRRSLSPKVVVIFAAVLVLVAFVFRRKYLVFRRPASLSASRLNIGLTALAALVVIFSPIFIRIEYPGALQQYIGILARVLFAGTLILAARVMWRRLQFSSHSDKPVTVILLVAGVFWAYGCGLSYRVEQHSLLFAVAYLVAAACDGLTSRSGKPIVGILTAVCLLQAGELALYKYNDAYDWNGWRSVIPLKTRTSHWPQLAGFRADGASIYMIDSILNDIARGTKPGEPIFTFPSIPMFNFINGHPQPTFDPVHYWDVCPDWLAVADAARVKAAKPAMIVDMDMQEWIWEDNELNFRKSKRSGQRTIKAVIDEMTASGDYRLVQSLWTPRIHTKVNVWQRIR